MPFLLYRPRAHEKGSMPPRRHRVLQLTTHPWLDGRLDNSIVRIHYGYKRVICTSGMTARHCTLFTL